VPLRQLLCAVGEPLVEVLAAPRGFDADVRDVVIVDPDEEHGARPDDLVLVIGARGRSAERLVRASARAGAAAAAVKVGDDREARPLRSTAEDGGIALLGVRPEVRWEQLESFARSALDDARFTAESDADNPGDLFALAQTVATLTGGIVSIEDAASRVLAYSRSDDEVDELRRLSILGRRGPEPYLARLREWGVYERLRSGEQVVGVAARPELGIRRRMAVGIRAGKRPLGTIWVQEAGQPLAERAEQALLGAARVASLQLVRQRSESSAPRFRENLLAGLLDGRLDAAEVAASIGADPARPAAVVVFASVPVGGDRAELEFRRGETAGLVSVCAAAHRRNALVTTAGSRVRVLLPDLPGEPGKAASAARALAEEVVATTRAHPPARVRAGVGSVVGELAEVPQSRAEADRVLDAVEHGDGTEIATIDDVRSRVLVDEVLTALEDQQRHRDPRLERLAEHDAAGGRLGASLLAYLDAFGDVRRASEQLHVHPNTLRYRLRRATAITGLDLDDPGDRLNAHLQLLLARRSDRR
jgi:DNA-binding PucR family transcriptional regulator